MKYMLIKAFICCAAATAVCALAAEESAKLPPPFATKSVRNQPKVVPRPDGATLGRFLIAPP